MPPPTIYFVRHGETDWNAEARLQGHRDIRLNETGRMQAGEAGRRLRALAADFAELDYVASPMIRARETMERLREALGLPASTYRVDGRLMEASFGTWEGLTWAEVAKLDPEGSRARKAEMWGFVPPKGESYADLADRVTPCLEELSRNSVIVSHGGVARVLLTLLCDVPHQRVVRLEIWQGRVLVCRDGVYEWF